VTVVNIALAILAILVVAYSVLYAILQMAMAPPAARFLWQYRRRYTHRARALIDDLAARPLVSVVVPAFNEELTVVESVRGLLALEYDPLEIVIVNDGSADNTLDVLSQAFDLVAAPLAFAQPLASAPVHASYRSIAEPRLMVIDKENGGCKADAANAGINAASGELVLIVDADTVLDPESVRRAVLPFLENPATIALGGNVAIANGCRVDSGRIVDVALPDSWLARYQIIEYMRSFLLFRLACASHNGVVLISGAFGMFRRSALLAVGGYDRTAIGEDMDLTIRLQRYYRERRIPFHIAFDPNPLGWTQAPEDPASLRLQRYRWRRGLLQVLWRHRRMIGNPRYGVVGVSILPFILVFEGLGPLLEIAGYTATIIAALLGLVYWPHLVAVMVVSLLFGLSVSLIAVLFSDIATERYMEGGDLVSLVVVAVAESLGYRQWNAWLSCVGTGQAMTGKGGWGAMSRRAF
jgi:cellulose synthase/poly-beta-1,6-N-acetylglucosamine synthase-like glycosyltransferase